MRISDWRSDVCSSDLHQGSATIGWRGEGGLTSSVTGRYVSSQFEDDVNVRRLDDALTFDAALDVPLAAGISVEARAENLADRRVEAGILGAGLEERAPARPPWLADRHTPSRRARIARERGEEGNRGSSNVERRGMRTKQK